MSVTEEQEFRALVQKLQDRRTANDAARELADKVYGDGSDASLRGRAQLVYDVGAVPHLIAILESGPTEAMEDAATTLSNVTTVIELTEPVFDQGVLPPLMAILRNGPEHVKPGVANIIRNLGFLEHMKRKVFVGGVMPLLVKLLQEGCDVNNEYAKEYAISALLNLANHKNNAPAMLEYLTEIVASVQPYGPTGSYNADIWTRFLGFVYNLSAHLNTDEKARMRDAGIIELVKPSFETRDDPRSFVVATLCVANLLGHLENHPLLTSDVSMIEELLRVLHASMDGDWYADASWDLWAPLQGLANLSINEANKKLILEAGALKPVVAVLANRETEARAQQWAAKVLSNLSFATDLKSEPKAEEALKFVAEHGTTAEAREYAKLAVFQLRQRRESQKPAPSAAAGSAVNKGKHVMLSYPWTHQALFVWIKGFLEKQGFSVWMDLDQMSASVLESMAAAVEDSAAVIFCLSDDYKLSEACRTEGEYAYRLKRPMIPVKPDASYAADGWLGALCGNKLYFELTNEAEYEAKGQELVRELVRHGVPRADGAAASAGAATAPEENKERELKSALLRSERAEEEVKSLQRKLHQLETSGVPVTQGASTTDQRLQQVLGDMERINQRLQGIEGRLSKVERRRGCTIL